MRKGSGVGIRGSGEIVIRGLRLEQGAAIRQLQDALVAGPRSAHMSVPSRLRDAATKVATEILDAIAYLDQVSEAIEAAESARPDEAAA